MATIFSTNFPEDVSMRILNILSLQDLMSYDKVSTYTHKLVEKFASTEREAEDLTLEGKPVSRIFDGGLLHQRYKMHIFTTRPELLKSISTVREEVRTAGGNPDQIVDLYNHVAKQKTLPVEEMLAIVLSDYTTKQIPGRGEEGLAGTLKKAVDVRSSTIVREQTEDNQKKSASSLKLIWAILFHPNPIPKNREDYPNLIELESIQNTLGNFIKYHDSVETVTPFLSHPQIAQDMGRPLYEASYANRSNTALAILSHPNAKNIPAKGDYGLGCCLLPTRSVEITKAILSHKNAKDISIYGTDGFGYILHQAVEYNKPNNNAYLEKAKAIRDFSKAEEIDADGISGLTGSLHFAAIYGDKEMAKVILSFPNAKNIPQEGRYNLQETCKQFDLPNPKDAEKKA